MKYILLISIFLIGCSDSPDIEEQVNQIVKTKMEIAYAEGQRDAIQNDIKIEIVDDSMAVFTETPWNNCDDNSRFKCDISTYDTIHLSKK